MDDLRRIFWEEGLQYMKHGRHNSQFYGYRKFRAFFGVSADECAKLWQLLTMKANHSHPKHLLWCLLFLKQYNTEHVNAALVNADEKTFRLWCWRFIKLIAHANIIDWEKRKRNAAGECCVVSLDGTDFRIQEPTPRDNKWYSHKFHGPGLRYEIGVSIKGGDVVWASGGLPCGEWPDLNIARELYVHYANREITLADKGYRDKRFFKQPENAFERRVLSRHETLNGRLKNFAILKNIYRHPLVKHPLVFHACVNIVQLCIDNGEHIFSL